MTATKAYFGFPRVTEQFTTLSGGNWLATYPLLHLQTLQDGLSRVARTLDATTGSTVIIATAASPQACSALALVGHNLSQSATYRVRIWSDVAGTVLVYDQTGNIWDASYTAAELSGAVCTWVHRFAASGTITAGKIQVDITDTGNAAGYIQASYLEIAAVFDASYNFSKGSQYGFEWRSLEAVAIGGAAYIDPRPHPRVFKGNFEFAIRSESLGKFYEMQRQLKMHLPVLFVPLPTETTHLLRTVLFARQLDPGFSTMRGTMSIGMADSVPLSLKEIL